MELGAEMKRLAALGCCPAGNRVISLPETEPRNIEHTILFKKKKKKICVKNRLRQTNSTWSKVVRRLDGCVGTPRPWLLLELKKLSYV